MGLIENLDNIFLLTMSIFGSLWLGFFIRDVSKELSNKDKYYFWWRFAKIEHGIFLIGLIIIVLSIVIISVLHPGIWTLTLGDLR